jgi:mRNA interferase MazF
MTKGGSAEFTAGFPQRGEIYWVNLEPKSGAETGKIRPALVLSNDVNNEFAETVTVAPLTGSPSPKAYPFEVLLPKGHAGLKEASRVKLNQIRTIDKKRLQGCLGIVSPEYMEQVKRAIMVHLDLE